MSWFLWLVINAAYQPTDEEQQLFDIWQWI